MVLFWLNVLKADGRNEQELHPTIDSQGANLQ